MSSVMVFAPHPDDDIIGCGGSIAHHVKQGSPVSIVYMTSGEAGSLEYNSADLTRLREEEATSAAASLGVTDLTFLRFPDGYLEYNKESLGCIVTLIRAKKPIVIYLPHSGDVIPDHQITNRLVREGCRRAAGPWFREYGTEPWQVKTILGYEIWTPLQAVGYCEDITSDMPAKLNSLRMHHSQIKGMAYDEAIKGLNRYRGIMTGKGDYCECFQLVQAQI